MTAWAVDALVVLALCVITLGVLGFARMPDVYNQIHAASKTVFLGVVSLLVAAAVALGAVGAGRALLVAAFLLLTTPVAAHAVARAAWLADEPMRTGGDGGEVRDPQPLRGLRRGRRSARRGRGRSQRG